MSYPILEKLISRQINHWNDLRRYLKSEQDGTAPRPGPVLTVSRIAGSGGRQLAVELARRLGLDLQDQSMVQRIVHDRKLEDSLVGELDEASVNQARLWMKGVLNQRIFMKEQYHHDLVRIVARLASRGGVVFLGRGANLILGEKANLRVRVVASEKTRVENLRQRLDITHAEARLLIEETDRRRENFVRKVFHTEPGQAENYDLVLNSDRLGREAMIDLVMQTLLQRHALEEPRALHGAG